MNKKFAFLISLLLIFNGLNFNGFCESNYIKIIIDGNELNSNTNPIIKSGVMYVPIRIISEKLNAKVEWNEKQREITISKENLAVRISIESNIIEVNKKEIAIEYPPIIVSGRSFIPLDALSNILDCGTIYDQLNKKILITSQSFGKSYFKEQLAKCNDKNISANTPPSNMNIDKTKLKKIEDIRDYKRINDFVYSGKGQYLYKGTISFEDLYNKAAEWGMSDRIGLSQNAGRLMNVIILRSNSKFQVEPGINLSNGITIWIYDAESGDFNGVNSHRIE